MYTPLPESVQKSSKLPDLFITGESCKSVAKGLVVKRLGRADALYTADFPTRY